MAAEATENHQPAPPVGTSSSEGLGALVVRYLRWRYGGNGWALKPPLGYSRYLPRPLWYRALYQCGLKPRWLAERRLFNRYGQSMRDAWGA